MPSLLSLVLKLNWETEPFPQVGQDMDQTSASHDLPACTAYIYAIGMH